MSSPYPKSTTLQNKILLKDPSTNFLRGFLKGHCFQQTPRKSSRRDGINLIVATAKPVVSATTSKSSNGGRFYFNFTGFPFPLGPFLNRRTIRTEVSFLYRFCLMIWFISVQAWQSYYQTLFIFLVFFSFSFLLRGHCIFPFKLPENVCYMQ